MGLPLLFWLLAIIMPAPASSLNFTIAGGQIYTPGLAIVDAPQLGTPLGGDMLHVALDVTTNGRLPLPPQIAPNSPTRFYNITVFLYSYDTQHNFTVSNGTPTGDVGPILDQEPGSTVKHINWRWPSCLVGDGQPVRADSARGLYNISIRQNFRLNNQNYYTIFDLPISITNRIDNNPSMLSCSSLENPLLPPDQINATAASEVGVLFAPGDATQIDVTADGGLATTGSGLGPPRPAAKGSDGLGPSSAAAITSIRRTTGNGGWSSSSLSSLSSLCLSLSILTAACLVV